MTRTLYISLYLLFISTLGFAQKKCATDLFNAQLNQVPSLLQSPEKFESWLKATKLIPKTNRKSKKTGEIFTIPVVVHVIHQGESIGSESNISNEKILSQIENLNLDFRRQNADASNTPTEFLSVASDSEIEFVLAKQDPEGLPTDGIVRVLGTQSAYDFDEAALIASHSQWPTDQYLNLWVANMPDYLGFAQFPITNLEGIDGLQEINRKTDGVFIDYRYFGTGIISGNDYQSLGRTATHEVGHWLGLRHVWGDNSSCSQDDFCDDTPPQSSSTSGCPNHGEKESCGYISMFQNYMDYTDDVCMNIFTICQSGRMRTIIENSPRRASLLTSLGSIAPIMVTNDIGIREVISPKFGTCNTEITPQIEIRNYGTNNVNSIQIELLLNDVLLQTLNVSDANLAPLSTQVLTFETIENSKDVLSMSFKVKNVNGATDEKEDNNCHWQSIFYAPNYSIPLFENFEDSEATITNIWSVRSPDRASTFWSFDTAPNLTLDNQAAKLSYNTTNGINGGLDFLTSPVFDLTGIVTVDLAFKYAYSAPSDNHSDALFVMISTDCGETFDAKDIIYSRWASELRTTSAIRNNFTPEGPGDWNQVELNFGEYTNEQNVVIAFVGNNGSGNNIYVDDIEISTSNVNQYDISINNVFNVPIATCQTSIQPIVEIKNLGTIPVNSLTISTSIDELTDIKTIDNLNLLPGKTSTFPMPISDISNGEHLLSTEISSPNGQIDQEQTNNTQSTNLIVAQINETIPLKESFSTSFSYDKWGFVRTDSTDNREFYSDNDLDNTLMFSGFNQTHLGSENWFVSPILDFSETDFASMQFDVSYGQREGRNEQLEVLVSTNCGSTFDEIIYNKSGSDLSISDSNSEWFPSEPSHWRKETIDLNQYAGDDNIKIAFKVTNQNGNNLFIDNIEFFDVATPPNVAVKGTMAVYPNPASSSFQVQFDFNFKESITVSVVSLSGKVVLSQEFPNTLNQVYLVDNLNLSAGIYLIHAYGGNTSLTKRIAISNQ